MIPDSVRSLHLPGHEILEVLREDRHRFVLRTRHRDTATVTRVIRRPVPLQLAGLVEGVVTTGAGSLAGLDEEIIAVLEGFRVRVRLGDDPGLPAVVAAGLAADPLNQRVGYPFVTTRWIPGSTLQNAQLPPGKRADALAAVLQILARLHAHNVVYGDLKPQNIVAGPPSSGGGVHLIDLDTLRELPASHLPIQVTHLTPHYAAPEQEGDHPLLYLASDIYAFGVLACEVLGGARPGEPGFPPLLPPPWGPAVDACFRVRALDRPQAKDLLYFLQHGRAAGGPADLASAPPTWSGQVFAPQTIPVRERRPDRREEPPLPPPPVDPRGGFTVPVRDREEIGPLDVRAPAAWDGASTAGAEEEEEDQEVTGTEGGQGRSWVGLAVGLLLVGGVLAAAAGAAGYGLLRYRAHGEADAQAVALVAALKEHKTVPAKNNTQVLNRIVEDAGKAVATAPTPLAMGVHALASVWAQRWHYQSSRWNADLFAQGDALTAAALAEGRTPYAALARGILAGGACRKMPNSQAEERLKWCEESRALLGEASKDLASGEGGTEWLAVETHWAGVMTESAIADHFTAGSRPDDATTARRAALERCRSAETFLPSAPVNGPELVQDCLVIAGPLQEYPDYLRWSDWLIRVEQQDGGKVGADTIREIVAGIDPACASLSFSGSGYPLPPPADQLGGMLGLCRYLGLAALGCASQAEETRACARYAWQWGSEVTCLEYSEDDGVPWDAARKAVAAAPRKECVLSPSDFGPPPAPEPDPAEQARLDELERRRREAEEAQRRLDEAPEPDEPRRPIILPDPEPGEKPKDKKPGKGGKGKAGGDDD